MGKEKPVNSDTSVSLTFKIDSEYTEDLKCAYISSDTLYFSSLETEMCTTSFSDGEI